MFLPARTSRQARISLSQRTPDAVACDTFLDEQGVRQRRCRSSGAQRTEAIGVRTATGSDQLHHRAWREAFARRTAKASRGKRRTASVSPNSSKFWHRSMLSILRTRRLNSVTFGATVTVKDKKARPKRLPSSASTNSISNETPSVGFLRSARRCWPRTWATGLHSRTDEARKL